jgi:ElaA protein
LRAAVFVVEQDCVYQDVDGKDEEALHVIGVKNNEIRAYARIFDKGHYFEEASIGRVVVAKSERKFKYGHALMEASILAAETYFGQGKIKISAQAHLEHFYKSHGFIAVGEIYQEDGIPHTAMYKS